LKPARFRCLVLTIGADAARRSRDNVICVAVGHAVITGAILVRCRAREKTTKAHREWHPQGDPLDPSQITPPSLYGGCLGQKKSVNTKMQPGPFCPISRPPNASAALPQARRADRVWPTAQAAGTRGCRKILSPNRGGRGLRAGAYVGLSLSPLPGLGTFHRALTTRLTPWAKICRRSAAPGIWLNLAPMGGRPLVLPTNRDDRVSPHLRNREGGR